MNTDGGGLRAVTVFMGSGFAAMRRPGMTKVSYSPSTALETMFFMISLVPP
jgi:hypothetical protein